MTVVGIDKHRGGWTQTASGQKFYHREPNSHRFRLWDIAHQLAQVNRYGGSCRFPYSVAQHSVHMAEHAYKETQDVVLALDCLFHDAAEAYIGDMKRPIKYDLLDYLVLEDDVESALRHAFSFVGVPHIQTDACKEIDRRIVFDEKAQLLFDGGHDWSLGPAQPLGIKIRRWSFEKARKRFAQTATALAEMHVGVGVAHQILWER